MSIPAYIDLAHLRGADSIPLRPASADLIDYDKVAAHTAAATRRGRYHGPTNPHEYLLHKQGLVELDGELVPTLASMLCFGRNPQALLPRAVVDIGHYRGIDVVSSEVVHLEKDIGGTIFDQLARVQTYLWSNIHHGMTLASHILQRIEVHDYPEAVIRELVVNMLVHRDYTNFRSAARVFLFRNRITWISPGGLPEGITVDNLLYSQAARNPVILSILYEAGYVEAIGQGLATVVTELKRAAMSAPTFEDTGASFIASVYGMGLDILSVAEPYARLNEFERLILVIIRRHESASFRDLRAALSNRSDRAIRRDLKHLLELNKILSVGRGRAQHYVMNEPF